MVRIANALGLVILMVALLILSLISYVSIRKDSIFSSTKNDNMGGPRIMFHAGFRSQFAMNFLDPSFIPLTNALNEELQGKPSKWKFNRTAFYQQRKEIFHYIDVANNFSLTKNGVRVGQLMHFDYSSHKYVFSISNNLKSLLPDASPIQNKHYNVCAVVGNSGILTGSHCGPEIDSADFIFRCNFAPTDSYYKDVGRKTNLTTFNPSILERYYNNLLTIQDRNNFFLNLKKLEGAILWIPAFFLHTSATVTRTLVDFFVEHKGQLKIELAWPGNIMQDVNKLDMGKITEKLLLERCTPKNTKLEQVKTLNLSKLGLKSSDLPVPLLSRLRCLEQLDLSGNRLQEMPSGLVLPSLRSLDLTNNEMEDVTTLDTLTTLEDLRMEDNLYITVNDNYKLIILLPMLRFYNGKDISNTANHVRYANSENLRKRVLALWETSFSLPDHRTAEKLAIVERDFVSAVRHKVKYGPSSLTDYTKWRVEMIAKEHLRSLTEPNEEHRDTEEPADTKENCNFPFPAKRKRSASAVKCDVTLNPQKIARSSRLQSIPHKAERPISTTPRTHKAAQIPATPIRGQSKLLVTPRNGLREKQHQSKEDMPLAKRTRKSARQQRSTEVHEMPGKVICTKSQHSSQEPVSLQPLHVLQCHSKQDSPDDFSTQLWACSFQPPLDYNGDVNGATRIVATCGGESVCLIDCETGLVMKKYKVPGEEFFSLAWSTVLMSRKGNVGMRPCSILAAGGKRGLVKLLHPRANMAYGEFRASRKALSILCFSPRQGNLLFTGSYDKNILLWDIGGVDSDYNFKVTQLLVLETTSTPLHFCLPPATPDTHLLAACEKGLHSYNIQLNKDPKKRSEEMEITFPVYEKDKDHDYHTIDGLGFLTNDVVASKSHMQGSIYLWSWNDTRAQRPNNNNNKKKKKEVCAVILVELQWSSTDIPYLSLNTCPSKGYVVCGDERGRLWTYHVTDLKANFRSGKAIPATEILAWPLPVRNGQGPVEGPPINSVAMDPELRYLVALSDKNMAVVWIRTESS